MTIKISKSKEKPQTRKGARSHTRAWLAIAKPLTPLTPLRRQTIHLHLSMACHAKNLSRPYSARSVHASTPTLRAHMSSHGCANIHQPGLSKVIASVHR